jgi:nucleoside-diphosphate-sugar epimerase
MKKALILGAGGFIGSHMARRLKTEGYWVRGVDLKAPDFSPTVCDEFTFADLRDYENVRAAIKLSNNETFEEIYQFAADMGGAGYIFTGDNDADIMQNSASINLNTLRAVQEQNSTLGKNSTKIFYSSSACMYPEHNQLDSDNPNCEESSAYPANPDSEYGWEKLFSERIFLAYNRNYKIPVRIARYHNIFGPEGTWTGGKEKAPAAICRKVIQSDGEIEIWGDGNQTRSFLYIDECIEATRRLMESEFIGPVNIGSEEMVTINKLVEIASQVENKKIKVSHIPGPLGVRGRNSNNDLIRAKLGWDYSMSLKQGIALTYDWIKQQNSLGK